jgi:hypothetical protein
MTGTQGWSIERKQAAALKDAVDDGMREIVIVQDVSPGGERLVGGEDHGASAPMPVVDHVEEHVGSIGTIGEVADLVNDEDVGMCISCQGR